MADPIDSSYMLRSRLGHHLTTMKNLDPLVKQRNKTRVLRRQLLRKYGKACAYCGRRRKVDTAHIEPLEIGGPTTAENLILLCTPCHKEYDNGAASIKEMLAVADRWKRRGPPAPSRAGLRVAVPPEPTMTRSPASVSRVLSEVLVLQMERKYRKAVKTINGELAHSSSADAGRLYLMIKRAELMRRRSGRGTVKQALQYIEEIKPAEVPHQYLLVFYYEYGYIHRLMGHHVEAARLMKLSADASQKQTKDSILPIDFVAASANELLCLMADKESLTAKDAKTFERSFNELEVLSRKHGGYWGGRWAVNCATHKLQVQLKSGNKKASWRTLKALRECYFSLDVHTGWDAGGRQSVSQLEGLTRVLFSRSNEDLETGIGLLARSFLSRLGPRQRPEGVRDAGFGLSRGLRKKGGATCTKTSLVLENLMNQTMDGTSVIWPWKAEWLVTD